MQEPKNKGRSDDSSDRGNASNGGGGRNGGDDKQDKFTQRGSKLPSDARGERDASSDAPVSDAKAAKESSGALVDPRARPASPFTLLSQLSLEMDRMFDEFWRAPLGLAPAGSSSRPLAREKASSPAGDAPWAPDIELHEHDGELVVRADLPGMNKDDVHVDVADRVLTIQGERRQECEKEDAGHLGVYRSECRYGSFFRSIPLPEGVDAGKVEASFENGVLEIRMPAPERRATNRRRIQVRGREDEHGGRGPSSRGS